MFRRTPRDLAKNQAEQRIMRDAKNVYVYVYRYVEITHKVNKYLDDVLDKPDGEIVLKKVRKLASDAIYDIQHSNHPSQAKVERQVKVQESINKALRRNEDSVHEYQRIEL